MEVEFLAKFNKDISSIKSRSLKGQILQVISDVEQAKSIKGS